MRPEGLVAAVPPRGDDAAGQGRDSPADGGDGGDQDAGHDPEDCTLMRGAVRSIGSRVLMICSAIPGAMPGWRLMRAAQVCSQACTKGLLEEIFLTPNACPPIRESVRPGAP